MFLKSDVPACDVVTKWHNTARIAGPAFESFFEMKKDRAVPLSRNFVATHDSRRNTYSLVRFGEEGVYRDVSLIVPNIRVKSLDIWDRERKTVPCTHSTIASLGVALSTIVDDVQEACLEMSDHIRPRDGVRLPSSFYVLTR